MVEAVYVWIILSGLVWAIAFAEVARSGGETLGLGRSWRACGVLLAALSPLLSFGLDFGNNSVMVAALCCLR